MMQFTGEKGGEVSGVFANGEAWSVKFDANGKASVKDPQIEAALLAASEHPDSGLKASKAKG